MRLSASLVLLLGAAVPAMAEDAAPVTPTPAPPTSETPAPAPAPAVNAEAAATDDIDPLRRAELKAKANKAKAGSAPASPWGFGFNLTAGYDSNILLESRDNPIATDAKGLADGAEVHGSYQILSGDTGRLSASGSTEINQYPSQSTANMIRYGGALAASWSLGGFDPGLVVGYNKFYLDGDVAANATSINVYVAKVFERNVSILGAGSQYVDYIGSDDSTGTTYDLNYRHWVLLVPGEINKRLELGWKISALQANNVDSAYGTQVPSVGLNWRFGPSQADYGTVDVNVKGALEVRSYHPPSDGVTEAERQKLWTVGASADVWLNTAMSVGTYLGYAKRTSNVEFDDYTRLQAGVRLAANW